MKKNILFGLIILSFVLAGCKQDVKEEKEASTEVTKELSGGQEEVTETPSLHHNRQKQQSATPQHVEFLS